MIEYKRNPNTKCLICCKNIYRRPSVIKRNGNKLFCGRACFGIFCRKEKPCVVFGKPILAGLNKKTCSRSCSNIHRARIRYKIGRPNDKARTLRIIKTQLFKLRGKKCERCEYSKYEILHVHHKDRDVNNNSPENLELICPNCHYEEHYLEKSWLKEKVAE